MKEAWQIVWSHKAFFALFSIVFVAINIFGNGNDSGWAALFGVIAAVIWSYVQTGVGLAVADGKVEQLSYKKISLFFPGIRQLGEFALVGLMAGLIFLGGVVLLVIPGIYFAVRLSFARNAYVDRNEGVMKALRYSWDITEGHFWAVFGVSLQLVALLLLSILVLFVGLLVAYPITVIVQARLYRTLSALYEGRAVSADTAIQVQPEELPVPAAHS